MTKYQQNLRPRLTHTPARREYIQNSKIQHYQKSHYPTNIYTQICIYHFKNKHKSPNTTLFKIYQFHLSSIYIDSVKFLTDALNFHDLELKFIAKVRAFTRISPRVSFWFDLLVLFSD